MNSENFYDQLASEEFTVSQDQFQKEMKQIQHALDKDLGRDLQESSAMVNPLGLQEASLYNQRLGIGQAPNFGMPAGSRAPYDGVDSVQPSARNLHESSDLTLDMLAAKDQAAMRGLPPHEQPLGLPDQASHLRAQNQARNPNAHGQDMHASSMAPPEFGKHPTGDMQFDDGFSLEQFRQNNAQLQEIMMQLQTTPHVDLPSAVAPKAPAPVSQPASQLPERAMSQAGTQFSSNPTAKTNSNPSYKQSDEFELPSTSAPVPNQFSYQQPQGDLGAYTPANDFHKIDLLQKAIGKPLQPPGSQPQPGAPGGYRQTFVPNLALQNAGHSIIDSKENYNSRNGGNQTQQQPVPNMPYRQVSQVELLSQLQQSSHTLQSSQMPSSRQPPSLGPGQSANPYANQPQPQPQPQPAQQQSLAGEFTLQPRAPNPAAAQQAIQQTQQHQSAKAPSMVQDQHKAIMAHFDDIPISQIQKMPGYQTGQEMMDARIEMAAQAQQENPVDEEDVGDKPVEELVHSRDWKHRHQAYKQINTAFYNDYALYEKSKQDAATPGGDPELMVSFDKYGPLLEKMIQDANLTAAYEALQVMYTYMQLAVDVKQVTFAAHNYLLEKVQTNKPNFRDITMKILLLSLKRDQAPYIYPELIKRFKSPTLKIASFSMLVVLEALKTETALEELNLRHVFKMVQDNLQKNQRELKDLATQILQQVFINCGDDVATLLANCKGLRPIQAKEIKEMLSNSSKNVRSPLIKLFDGVPPGEEGEPSASAKDAKDAEGALRHGNANAGPFDAPTRDVHNASAASLQAEPADLLLLVPDNFQEIPYMTQINVKRKSMEAFNSELTKLLQQGGNRPGAVPIKNKDYTMIHNTVVHMLEDKNMLVFVEAIRTVELLCLLIGPLNYLKQPKVKTLISLIAGKYGETKTAVIAAVDKALMAVVKHAYNQVQFCCECVNQIAQTHKNPRVKQFVVEHTMIPFVESIRDQKDLCGNIFKMIKEKLLAMVQKDTSASCRDAAVSLLVTFKTIVPQNPLVEAAVTSLPKYRVAEIQKRVGDSGVKAQNAQTQPAQTPQASSNSTPAPKGGVLVEDPTAQPAKEGVQKPQFAKSLSQRIKSAKQGAATAGGTQASQSTMTKEFVEEMIKGRFVANETRQPLSEILYDLALMRANQFTQLYDSGTMDAKWEEALRTMGELGIRESKPILMNALHAVITTPKISLFDNQQSLRSMLNLAKRLYVIERSIERLENGRSQELENFLKLSLLQNVWLTANQGETCQMLQVGMVASGNVFEFTEHLRDVVEQPIVIKCPAALQIIEAVYVWLGIRLNEFLAQGMQIGDLEELRTFGLKFLDGAGFNEAQRQALIQIMIKFKDMVAFKRQELEQQHVSQLTSQVTSQSIDEDGDQELPSVSRMSRQHTPWVQRDDEEAAPAESESQTLQQSSKMTHPQTANFRGESLMQESVSASQQEQTPVLGTDDAQSAEKICSLIDVEFEKGLLLFKEMAQTQSLEFAFKERIFDKLLSIVTEGYRANPQQQYKQAYALKALMWMKEETLGVEDAFRLTQSVMLAFARIEAAESDSTVELYMLNFWSKDLSIRDLADRIGLAVLNCEAASREDRAYQTGYSTSAMATKCSPLQLRVFNALLKWLAEKRLFSEDGVGAEEWQVTDLRKIVLYLTLSVLDTKERAVSEESRHLVGRCVAKFGAERVKEFMEIQLMHHNELSLKLLDWFSTRFEGAPPKMPAEPPRHLASDSLDMTADDASLEEEKSVQLPSIPRVNIEELAAQASRSRLHEASIQSGGDSSAKQSQTSKRLTPRGLVSASQSYKERRDQYKMKSSSKPADGQSSGDISQRGPSTNYEDIISRIEQNLGREARTAAVPSEYEREAQHNPKQIDEASGESGEDTNAKFVGVGSEPESALPSQTDATEPYQLNSRAFSTDKPPALEQEPTGEEARDQPFRTTNTSAYYRSIERKRNRYTPSAEELADENEIKADSDSEEELVRNSEVQKGEPVEAAKAAIEKPHGMRALESELELSAMKERHINDKIQMLEMEKQRIEQQSELLKQERDQESQEWKLKVSQMEQEHAKVVTNLDSVNCQYGQQVAENERLKSQLEVMQQQHSEMMNRFEQIEKRINEDRQREARHAAISPESVRRGTIERESTSKKELVVSVQKLQRIQDTFSGGRQLAGHSHDSEEAIRFITQKIQDLLLKVEKNVEGELAKPLIIHYQKLKVADERMRMLRALQSALEQNEDVLNALSADVYKALLNFLLYAFAHEKQILENTSVGGPGQRGDQNDVTMLSQQLVSKLLNSKRFTTSLVALFQLLRDAMPSDIEAVLSVEERQFLRVVMRCIQRITRALHSEQPDLVRAFDVLLEMQKMFVRHPPEQLREDLPCLADFDFVYRGMKDVSDKLIELQPDKVESFLGYATQSEDGQHSGNAFIKYLSQMLGAQ